MPYVNIKITKQSATSDQKAEIIRGITEILSDVLGTDPQKTLVVIEEIDGDNWGIGGETFSAMLPTPTDEPEEHKPRPRGLPENLIRYLEEKKRGQIEPQVSDFEPSRQDDNPRGKRGRRKKTED